LQRRRIDGARDEATGSTLAHDVKTVGVALDLQRIIRAVKRTGKGEREQLLRWRIPPARSLAKAQIVVFFVRLCDHRSFLLSRSRAKPGFCGNSAGLDPDSDAATAVGNARLLSAPTGGDTRQLVKVYGQ
jgi:hypothetical protein